MALIRTLNLDPVGPIAGRHEQRTLHDSPVDRRRAVEDAYLRYTARQRKRAQAAQARAATERLPEMERAALALDSKYRDADEKCQNMLGCWRNPLRNTTAGAMIGVHLEFRTTRDGESYSKDEFIDFFGLPYAEIAWARSLAATPKEKHKVLLRRLHLAVEKAKIKQLLLMLRENLAADGSVEIILAFAFPNIATILPQIEKLRNNVFRLSRNAPLRR